MKKLLNVRAILSIIIIAFGAVLAIIPDKYNPSKELNAKDVLLEINTGTHMLSADEVAKRIMSGDPSIQLIDIRSAKEFAEFTLPNAINIPFDSLLNESYESYVNQDKKTNIFYSNGTVLSVEAWMLTKQKGYKNNYILKGGINAWFNKIIQPIEPDATASSEEFEIYQTRLGASQFFAGKKETSTDVNSSIKPSGAPVKTGKKKQSVQGGCS
jgi:rhodanese-related sulfurtransferase